MDYSTPQTLFLVIEYTDYKVKSLECVLLIN